MTQLECVTHNARTYQEEETLVQPGRFGLRPQVQKVAGAGKLGLGDRLLQAESDWPLAAAIRVAAEIALHEPESTRELRQLLIALTPQMNNEPNGGLSRTLLTALEMLPQVPAQYRDRLRAKIDSEQNEASPEAPPNPTTQSKRRPWWKFWGPN